jgi:hypothetical protein
VNRTSKMKNKIKEKSAEKENREVIIRDYVIKMEAIDKQNLPGLDGMFECNRLISELESKLFYGSLPSKHQIGDIVDIEFYKSGKIKECKIKSVKFSKGSVKYDVAILLLDSNEDQKKDSKRWTVIKNVDETCITD